MKMRPPATPIVNIDPYFSVWTEESVLRNTVHWTGKPNTMTGRVFVDGVMVDDGGTTPYEGE